MKKYVIIYTIFCCLGLVLFSSYIVKKDFDLNLVDYMNYSQKLSQEEREKLMKIDKITYSADRNSPPLRFVNEENQQYIGVVVDFMNALSLELSKPIIFEPLEWRSAQTEITNKEIYIGDMFRSDLREKQYKFTMPLYNLKGGIVHKNRISIKDISDFKGKKVAVPEGDYSAEFLKKEGIGVELSIVKNTESGLKLLANDDVVAVFGDQPVLSYILNNKTKYEGIVLSDYVPYKKNVYLATSKNTPEVVMTVLNKGILELHKKGEFQTISAKWTGIESTIEHKLGFSSLIFKSFILIVIIGYIILFFYLISSGLKREIRKKTAVIERNKNELQTIFHAMPTIHFIISQNLVLKRYNKKFEDKYGNKLSASDSKVLKDIIPNIFYQKLLEILDELKKEDTNIGWRKVNLDNKRYTITCNYLNEDEHDLLIGFEDTTFKDLEDEQLKQMNKMVEIGQLSSGIAHEIRNPLGIIKSYIYLLKYHEKVKRNTELKEYVNAIDMSATRAKKIIDNLLNFSSNQPTEFHEIMILNELDNIKVMYADKLKSKGLEFNYFVEGNSIIYSNSDSLTHIFTNLLSNSIDVCTRGDIITVKIINKSKYNYSIDFYDSGSGIPKEKLGQIFNPFYTTKELGEGTGLGLYIVFNEVKNLSGNIQVFSDIGKGTRFIMKMEQEGYNE